VPEVAATTKKPKPLPRIYEYWSYYSRISRNRECTVDIYAESKRALFSAGPELGRAFKSQNSGV
jgi:hypothetical protein